MKQEAVSRTHYAVLGIRQSATDLEVRRAYRKLAARHHPDRNPGNQSAEAVFREINASYLILSDPQKRKSYDRTLPAAAVRPRRERTLGDIIERELEAPSVKPGDLIEEALRRSSSRKSEKKPKPPRGAVRFWDFSRWTQSKLPKEFGRGAEGFFWRKQKMTALNFVRTYVEPYDFEINPFVLAGIAEGFDRTSELNTTFFVDATRSVPKPIVWGKHRATVACDLGPDLSVLVFLRVL